MAKPGFGFVRGGVVVGLGVRRGEAGDVWPIRPVGVVTACNKSNRSSLVKASARQRARLSVLETMFGGRGALAEGRVMCTHERVHVHERSRTCAREYSCAPSLSRACTRARRPSAGFGIGIRFYTLDYTTQHPSESSYRTGISESAAVCGAVWRACTSMKYALDFETSMRVRFHIFNQTNPIAFRSHRLKIQI